MAGLATYEVSGPGGAVYRVQGPAGANPAEILGAMGAHPSNTATASGGGWLNDIALAGRDVGEGVLDTLAAPHDLGIALQNGMRSLGNRVFGTHLAPQPTFSGQLSRALTFLGAPVPRTPDQQLGASVLKGATGALTGGAALGFGGIANTVRAMLSGATGGTSADLAREGGAGPAGQFVAGLAGGLAPSAIEGVLPALNPRLSVNPLTRAFTRAGQTQLAANTLAREATDPAQAATNLENAATLVPGSMRTTGEASGDTGLLALEKGIRARNPGAFGERISQQNAARQAELAALGGTPADIAAAEALRENETAPMREAAFAKGRAARQSTELSEPPPDGPYDVGLVGYPGGAKYIITRGREPFVEEGQEMPRRFDTEEEARQAIADLGEPSGATQATTGVAAPTPGASGVAPVQQVHDVIDQLLASPAGARESIAKTLNWAKGLIGTHDDPETLYEVRKDLALAQRDQLQPGGRDAPNATMLAQARGQLGKVISSLDDAIESAAPGYKDYLGRYSELSEPVDQMQAIQNLQKRTSSGLDTATGEPFLSSPQFARQLRSTLERADGPFSPKLTPNQTQRLEAVREDLQRAGAVGNPTVRTPGSDSFQQFMMGRRTGSGLLSHVPFLSKFLAPASKWVDSRVNAQLSDAMLDPQRAAQLLRQGTLPLPVRLTMARGLGRAALPATAGPLAALPRPTASTGLIPQPSAITAWLEHHLSPLTGQSPAVAPSSAVQAFLGTVDPARWAQEVNSGRAPVLSQRIPEHAHAHLTSHVHRVLAGARRGAVRGPGGALHVRHAPGRHVTILPPSSAGGVPQVLSGIVSMPR